MGAEMKKAHVIMGLDQIMAERVGFRNYAQISPFSWHFFDFYTTMRTLLCKSTETIRLAVHHCKTNGSLGYSAQPRRYSITERKDCCQTHHLRLSGRWSISPHRAVINDWTRPKGVSRHGSKLPLNAAINRSMNNATEACYFEVANLHNYYRGIPIESNVTGNKA